ncbi:MAG: 2-oxo acid dehydrogenase subunit E2 [Planctomycetes bacterium]|nr:2-oxo acid dehydrogenase subunit E2 [Planctomycetota bacterium]
MDFRLPELGEGVYEAELVSWLVQPGATVKHGQNLMEMMTDKATMEIPAPFAGTITALKAEPGQKLKVGEVVLDYTEGSPAGTTAEVHPDGAAHKGHAEPVSESPTPDQGVAVLADHPASPPESLSVKAAPSIRYLARQLGIDLTRIQGSGPGGRILMNDLASHIKNAEPSAPKSAAEQTRPDYGTPGTRIKLVGLRRKIAEHMVQAKQTIPHYTYVDECDVTELVRLREALRETYARAGVKLTYLAFFVKAVTAALKEVPLVNATLDTEAGEIVLHDHYHIGLAVATSNGLVVPVIRDAGQKDLTQLAREIERLGTEARTGKVRLEDLRGSTFTITSVGNIGGLFSTPVINSPEVGILGLGKVVKRPVFDAAGNVRPADLIYLSLSFDHRVVDGAVGAVFGNAIIRQIQKPAALLLPAKGI